MWRDLGFLTAQLQPAGYWDTINEDPNQFLRLEYPHWGTTNDNGTLQSTQIYAGDPAQWPTLPNATQTFQYDGVNRLISVSEGSSWSQSYSYDAYGNMWMPGNSLTPPSFGPVAPTANVYANNQNQNSIYDGAGNLSALGAMPLTYDAENKQTGAGPNVYSYDGSGQRVSRTTSSGQTIYVYDAFGQLAAEYSTAAVNPACTTCYLSYDHLGSVRMVTDQNANVIARHDYAPFGQEIPGGVGPRTSLWGAGDDVTQRFTGKERDSESGLDYFGARYYGSALGRFTSPDWSEKVEPVPYAELENPQSLNLYAYTRNNPLNHADLDGHCTVDGENHGSVWCWFHDHGGWVQTQKEQADAARKALSQMHGFTINGMTPADFARGASNQRAIAGLRSADNFVAGQGLSICGPGVSCGVVFPLGPYPETVAGESAEAAGAGGLSDFINITKKGSVPNIQTNVSAADLGKNLEANGFTKTTASDGTPIYTKGNTQYTVYPKSNSTGGPTAQVKINGAVVEKIRLQ